MASAAIQGQSGHLTSFEPLETTVQTTSTAAITNPHHVTTTLNYYKDPGDGSVPPPSYVGKPETYERPVEKLDVTVHDIRGREKLFTLDQNGFQIHVHKSLERDFLDDEQIKAVYYPETETLLKDVYVGIAHITLLFLTITSRTGASRVLIFDHTIRRAPQDQRASPAASLRGPVNRVHIDQSYTAAKSR